MIHRSDYRVKAISVGKNKQIKVRATLTYLQEKTPLLMIHDSSLGLSGQSNFRGKKNKQIKVRATVTYLQEKTPLLMIHDSSLGLLGQCNFRGKKQTNKSTCNCDLSPGKNTTPHDS